MIRRTNAFNMDEKQDDIVLKKKFIRLAEGPGIYSIGLSTFEKIAREAHATYKVGKIVLINMELLDRYIESFKEDQIDESYSNY